MQRTKGDHSTCPLTAFEEGLYTVPSNALLRSGWEGREMSSAYKMNSLQVKYVFPDSCRLFGASNFSMVWPSGSAFWPCW